MDSPIIMIIKSPETSTRVNTLFTHIDSRIPKKFKNDKTNTKSSAYRIGGYCGRRTTKYSENPIATAAAEVIDMKIVKQPTKRAVKLLPRASFT